MYGGTVDLAAGVAGKDVDVVGATSLVISTSVVTFKSVVMDTLVISSTNNLY